MLIHSYYIEIPFIHKLTSLKVKPWLIQMVTLHIATSLSFQSSFSTWLASFQCAISKPFQKKLQEGIDRVLLIKLQYPHLQDPKL